MKSEQLELDRTKAGTATPAALASDVKTILLHVQDEGGLKDHLETALSLARACSAHLSCIHVTPIQAYVAFDTFGGVFVMKDVIRTIEEEDTRLRAELEAELAREDVSWDYIQVTGNVPTEIVRYAALADLIVSGRHLHRTDFAGPTVGMLGEVLNRARTPVLVPGDSPGRFKPTGPALIAWDGSFEAANAVRASIGLLKIAANVRVFQVEEEKSASQFPGTKMLEFLSRHGIHAELTIDPAPGHRDAQFVAGSLMSQADGMGAGYIVMGGYSHSRIGEYLFGGVTRTLLGSCSIPLLIAH